MVEELVRDRMHRGVITCERDASVEAVAEAMNVHDVSALVVVDDAGDAVGVISRTDLMSVRFVEPYLEHGRLLTAEHLMSSPIISVCDSMPVTEALALLNDKRIHRLVVTKQDGPHVRLIGILSVTDLVRSI